jgi:hypothetical protein
MNSLSPTRRRMIVRIIIGALIVVILIIAVLVLFFKPRVDSVFSGIFKVTCVYTFKVNVFDDTNSDGIKNGPEQGIANVNVFIDPAFHPSDNNYTQDAVTSSDGLATFSADTYCSANDVLTVKVTLPTGYTATTPISFGPYPIPNFGTGSAAIETQTPLPGVIYVGLKKQS